MPEDLSVLKYNQGLLWVFPPRKANEGLWWISMCLQISYRVKVGEKPKQRAS